MVPPVKAKSVALAVALALMVLGGRVAIGCGLSQVGVSGSGEAGVDGPSGMDTAPPPGGDSSGMADQTPPDAPSGDAPIDGGALDAPADGPCDACALLAPSGWSLVAFATARANACPSQTTQVDVVENPNASPSACTCPATCTPTGNPDCTQASIPIVYGDNGCGQTAPNFPGAGGACTVLPQGDRTLSGNHTGIGNPTMSDQNCTPPSPVQNLNAVTSQSDRLCQPASSTCALAVCNASLPAGFTTCLLASGDQTCPVSTPNKHSVGSAPSLACSACGCTEEVSCSGSFTFYGNEACGTGSGGGGFSISIASNSCVPTTMGEAVGSYEWTASADASAPTCQEVGGSVPMTGLQGPETVCCP
jgi:hypothetical protein